MKIFVFALLILVAFSPPGAESAQVDMSEDFEEGKGPEVAIGDEAIAAPAQPLAKPDTFGSWSERMDYIHHNMHFHVQEAVDRVDTYFAEDGVQTVETPPSKLRLGLYFEFEIDSGLSLGVDPDYEMKVELPNLERRWNIIISGKGIDELPGTNPTERDGGANVGVQTGLDRLHIKLGGGIRVKWLPELYGEVKWVPIWSAGAWVFRPQIKGYYTTDDGFGNINSLMFYRWFGRYDRGMFRSTSAGRWTEETEGVEWEQSFALGYVPELLQKRGRRQNVSAHDTARLIGFRASTFGQVSGEAIMDRYRGTLVLRFPLYRNFVYGEIMPEIEWRDEDDWDAIQRITLGVDLLFWGVGPPNR